MPVVCPTILSDTEEGYREQIERVASFAHRIQIDLTDGVFAPSKTVRPADAWWPVGMKADLHLMFEDPLPAARELVKHKPNLIIVHAESKGNFNELARLCRDSGVKVGVALLAETPAETIADSLSDIDHVLIFSGNLGYQGGSRADLELLNKLSVLRKTNPNVEIGWDGGANDQNIAQLVFGGIDVINVGGFIQQADDPERAFRSLQRIADETGTT